MSQDFRQGFLAATLFWIVVLAAVGVFGKLFAGETWIVVSGYAVHFDGRKHCNDTTEGLGVEYQQTKDWALALGFYDNSQCRLTKYVAEVWCPLKFWKACAGLFGGLLTGYRKDPEDLAPVGGFVVATNGKTLGANFIYVPRIERGGNVLWIQGKVRW